MPPFTRPRPLRRVPFWIGFCLFLVIAVFLLWEEHRVHFLGALPFAILLLCPLIHVFMHRGHGHGGHGGDPDRPAPHHDDQVAPS